MGAFLGTLDLVTRSEEHLQFRQAMEELWSRAESVVCDVENFQLFELSYGARYLSEQVG